MARHPAYRTKIRAAKAWPGILSTRLGLIQPNACELFIWDRRLSATLGGTKPRRGRSPKNPSSFQFLRLSSPPKPSERRHARRRRKKELAAGGQPARGAAPPTRPLIDARRSPEGECAAVEPSHGGALLWRPEPTRGGCTVARCPSRSSSRRSKTANPTWHRGKTLTSLGLGF
jgi:hypothetical protein